MALTHINDFRREETKLYQQIYWCDGFTWCN